MTPAIMRIVVGSIASLSLKGYGFGLAAFAAYYKIDINCGN